METAIGVSMAVKSRLGAFKKTYSFKTYDDMLATMLNYFAEVGDDPTNPKFTAKAQMVEMNKRLDQVVRFQRVFEAQKLLPVLEELKKLTRQILEFVPSGSIAATKEDIEAVVELLESVPTHDDLTNAIVKLYDTLRSGGEKI